MSAVEVEVTENVKNFEVRGEPLRFRVGDDVFEAAPDVAAGLVMKFADQAAVLENDAASNDEKAEVVNRLFHLVLLPDSADRFVARLNDPTNPIGIRTFIEVTQWLLGEYGMRPTEPDSVS